MHPERCTKASMAVVPADKACVVKSECSGGSPTYDYQTDTASTVVAPTQPCSYMGHGRTNDHGGKDKEQQLHKLKAPAAHPLHARTLYEQHKLGGAPRSAAVPAAAASCSCQAQHHRGSFLLPNAGVLQVVGH